MKKIFLLLMILGSISLSTHSYEIATESLKGDKNLKKSSDGEHPHNKYMGSYSGVDLYSGNIHFSFPITNQISLSYSGNVATNARLRNDISHTSWLGLGWEYQPSSIYCHHNGTRDPADDYLYWRSPRGTISKILVKKNKGLRYKYYEATRGDLDDFLEENIVDSGLVGFITPGSAQRSVDFAFKFEGYLYIETPGDYTFHLTTGHNARLVIDGIEIIDNSDNSICNDALATVNLTEAGPYKKYHEIAVYYTQAENSCLVLEYAGADTENERKMIPGLVFIKDPPSDPFASPSGQDMEFFLEDFPYKKIEPEYSDAYGQSDIDGWVITSIDGSKLRYGKVDGPENHQAVRSTYRYGDFVGNGYKNPDQGDVGLIAYKWDLAISEDVFGSRINYYYDQITDGISCAGWNSGLQYTRESYLKEIIYTDNRKVTFILEDKKDASDNFEIYDPYTMENEDDCFTEFYETRRLKEIRIYGHKQDNTPAKQFHFVYTQLNDIDEPNAVYYGPAFAKSLLTEIHEVSGEHSMINPEILKTTKFEYNDDYTQVSNLEFPHGILKSVKSSLGTQTKFRTEKYSDFGFYKHWQRPTLLKIAYGTKDNGEEYLVESWKYVQDPGVVVVFDWDGTEWTHNGFSTYNFKDNKVIAGHNYFIILNDLEGEDDRHETIIVCHWDKREREWKKKKYEFAISTPLGPVNMLVDTAYVGHDFFAVRGGDGKQLLWLMNWNGIDWVPDKNYYGKLFTGVDKIQDISIGNQTIALVTDKDGESRNEMIVLRKRNDKEWYEQRIDAPQTPIPEIPPFPPYIIHKFQRVYVHNDYILTQTRPNNTDCELSIYNWTGIKWEADSDIYKKSWGNNHTKKITSTDDFVVASGIDDGVNAPDDTFVILTRNGGKTGGKWHEKSFDITPEPGSEDVDTIHALYAGRDFVIVHIKEHTDTATGTITDAFSMYNWNSNEWNANPLYDRKVLGKDLLIGTGYDYAAVCSWTLPNTIYDPDEDDYHINILSSHGRQWDMNEIANHQLSYILGTSLMTNTNNLILRMEYKKNSDPTNEETTGFVEMYRRSQRNFGGRPFAFMVTEKKNSDITKVEDEVITYEYGNPNYDFFAGTAKMNLATVNYKGKIRKRFFNDIQYDGPDPNPYYRELDGLVYANQSINELGYTITDNHTRYHVYKHPQWPSFVFQTLVDFNTSTIDNVSETFNYTYDIDFDEDKEWPRLTGLPRFADAENSDGKRLVNFKLFASEVDQYASVLGPDGAHMLSQPAMILSLENFDPVPNLPHKTWYENISKDTIRSATAIEWSNQHNPNGIWAPCCTFVWTVPMDNDGKPKEDFAAFEFDNPWGNPQWVYQGTNSKYDKWGHVIEKRMPYKDDDEYVYNTIIYNNKYGLPIATISNARYEECAVLTGDYRNGAEWDKEDFDLENGWDVGGLHEDEPQSTLHVCDGNPHFGQMSIHARKTYGPTKNIYGINPNRDYIFSAWVLPITGTMRFVAEARKNGGSSLDPQFHDYISGLTPNKWNYVERRITSSLLKNEWQNLGEGENDYLRIWIGNYPDDPESEQAEFFVDDIRFYPADALVTTTYYDLKWRIPIAVVDANNQSSERVTLDEYGRPIQTHKIKYNNSDKSIEKILTSEQEYTFVNAQVMAENEPPYAPTLIEPYYEKKIYVNDCNDPGFIQLKWWGGDPDNDAVTYTVEIGGNEYTDLDNPDLIVNNCECDSSYDWSVEATDEHGLVSSSEKFRFTVLPRPQELKPPYPIGGMSPQNGSVYRKLGENPPDILVSWAPTSDPDHEDGDVLIYSVTYNNGTKLSFGDGTETRAVLDNLSFGTKAVYWYVTVRDKDGLINYSNMNTIRIEYDIAKPDE